MCAPQSATNSPRTSLTKENDVVKIAVVHNSTMASALIFMFSTSPFEHFPRASKTLPNDTKTKTAAKEEHTVPATQPQLSQLFPLWGDF